VIAHVEAARAKGQRITADMYTYPAGSTGFDAAIADWCRPEASRSGSSG